MSDFLQKYASPLLFTLVNIISTRFILLMYISSGFVRLLFCQEFMKLRLVGNKQIVVLEGSIARAAAIKKHW